VDAVRLAYRDTDRAPVIFCIKEMAARHYDLDVQIVRILDTPDYEAALFDGSADLICEHVEYLFQEVAQHGRRVTLFLCPVREAEAQMVVAPQIKSGDDLRGTRIAVRTHGRPHEIVMHLRALGLEGSVELLPVSDDDVGRWRQWVRVADGTCAATFVRCLHLPAALEAGLHVLSAPRLDIVGHFHQACTAEYAYSHDDVIRRYVKAAVHAICLMKLRREEALDIVSGEAARLMKLDQDRPELERWFDCIAGSLQLKPYPTPAGIANSYEIACAEWPGGKGINPMTLWDLHWLKELDDEGFVDGVISQLST